MYQIAVRVMPSVFNKGSLQFGWRLCESRHQGFETEPKSMMLKDAGILREHGERWHEKRGERRKNTTRDLQHCDNEQRDLSNYGNVCIEAEFPPIPPQYSHISSSPSAPHSLSLPRPSHLQTLLYRHAVCLVNMKPLRCQYLILLQLTETEIAGGREKKRERGWKSSLVDGGTK